MDKKIALIDGYGFVFRAYHSLPPLTRPDGTPVGAVYGFTNMLIKLLAGLDVTHGAIAFDGDLGIWFESDYGTNTGLIVKAIRQNSYSFNETEIHVGDELLYLNGIQLIGLAFDEAINTLKHHLLTLSSKRRDGPNFGTPVKQGRHRSQKFQKNLILKNHILMNLMLNQKMVHLI
jgi:hypothetical protein